jgi:N-acetyl-beta-hexosaminidase
MKAAQKSVAILVLMFLISFSAKSNTRLEEKVFRGFMIDAPRGVETIEYYFRLIDFCQEEGFNSIIFRLTDDQGSAFLFTSHPELNMCEGAFSAKELKTIVDYAQNNGIEMIPEIESFGHSRYIIQTKKYKFLKDRKSVV